MKIAIVRERADGETRVAATPETVTKLIGLGASVAIESGRGRLGALPRRRLRDGRRDASASAADVVKDADIVLTRAPSGRRRLLGAKAGRAGDRHDGPLWQRGRDRFAWPRPASPPIAMEFMPRITRAQVMDILSSQANLAGYQAVIDAAVAFDRAMPMMMTAAGTVRPAKVFVMGAGVAGLQAIATAKRLGAVVTRDRRARGRRRAGGVAGRQVHHDRCAEGCVGHRRLCARADRRTSRRRRPS